MRVPVAPHPPQCVVLSVFGIFAVLMGVQWYVIDVLICNSLKTYDVEHLLVLFAICIDLCPVY